MTAEDSPNPTSAPYIETMSERTAPLLQEAPAPPLMPREDLGIPFKLVSEYAPAGDQPQAIEELVAGLEAGEKDQVLLGVTGSGKTFTVAHVIERMQRPALVLAPNKTLAAQLYGEMKSFFPDNAVEYFVSAITTTTSPKPTSPARTPTSKRNRLGE